MFHDRIDDVMKWVEMEDIYNAIVDSDSDEDDDDDESSCGSEMVVDAKSDEKQPSKLLPPPLQQQPTAAESITTAISLKVASLVQRMLGLSQEYQELHEELMNEQHFRKIVPLLK
mmetsp:Transcript_12792/g.19119  ORF Transcript_12792/g.19119 Transcript_12792/m.19119 type:complete len:115 (-) Transcript_12792:494-838(-)